MPQPWEYFCYLFCGDIPETVLGNISEKIMGAISIKIQLRITLLLVMILKEEFLEELFLN